mgnify:CR=1 FL=1
MARTRLRRHDEVYFTRVICFNHSSSPPFRIGGRPAEQDGMGNRITAYPSADLSRFLAAPTLIERLALWRRSRRAIRRRDRYDPAIRLDLHGGGAPRPLAADDVPLVCLAHDDRRFVPALLAHYRRLGVTRFAVVDDGSTDGTAEMLAAEPDVDLYRSNVRYRDAARGRAWREALLARYGAGRWCLNIDSDEFLVFAGMEGERPLPRLLARMDALGIRRVAAPMIDLYHPGEAAAADFDGADGRMPWQVATHLDADGYRLERGGSALSLTGGMRGRCFGSEVELMKYPLLRWQAGDCFARTIHRPAPYGPNFAPIFAVLLHFKFFSDLEERLRAAVADGQYFDGAREYRKLLDKVDAGPLAFGCERSVPYLGPDDLVARGFMLSAFAGA